MVAMGTPPQKSPGYAPGTKPRRTVKTSTAYQLKVELLAVKPAVWRRILVPSTIKLSKLHSVLLRAMGWQGGHLHEFIFADASYGIPDDEWDLPPSGPAPESRVTLLKALGGLRTFTYVYDYGDNWEHKVRLERVVDNGVPITTPICVAGENACPPEDVGGAPGYEEFLDAIADPHHPEHESMLSWCGGSFDPTAFDLAQISQDLGGIKL